MMTSQVEMQFCDFCEKWMNQLEDFVKLLIVVSKEQNPPESVQEAAVNKLTAHHKEFYTFKWAAAHQDVLAVFTPVWLSPLENAHLWVTGWKPSMALRLLDSLRGAAPPVATRLANLTDEQVRKIEGLKARIKAEEEKVERVMERLQVGMADRKIVELARLERRTRKEGVAKEMEKVDRMVDAAVKGLLAGLEKAMKMADCVRLRALKGILDILTPAQCVDYLAANATLQIQLRKWGRMRVKEKRNGTGATAAAAGTGNVTGEGGDQGTVVV